MEEGWICIIIGLSVVLWIEPRSAAGFSEDVFIPVPHVPGAATVSIAPFAYKKVYCAGACLKQDSCQGFLMAWAEAHPCRLLIGLDGSKTAADLQIEAFVTLYYNGVKHYLRTTKQSWNQAVPFCQSLGMEMISYPLEMDKRNWLSALNPKRLLIGAKKDWSDNNRVYDINTNSLLTVDWLTTEGIWQSNIIVLFDGKFRTGNDWFQWSSITLVCAPVS